MDSGKKSSNIPDGQSCHRFEEHISDSEIVQNIKFGRTIATGLIHEVIGKAGEEELFKSLRKGKLVLIVDESTDKTNAKFFVILNK